MRDYPATIKLVQDGKVKLAPFITARIPLDHLSIIGSIAGTRQDVAEVFALHAAGKTKVIAETRELTDVNLAIKEVLAGQIPARLVFTF